MDNQLFKIPTTPEAIVRLIEAVPRYWSWLHGHLDVPSRFVSDGSAEWNTGFSLGCNSCIHPNVVGRIIDNNSRRRAKPDFPSVTTGGKLYGFVEFKEAGYEDSYVDLETAKKTLIGFIKKGYHGDFSFVYYPDGRKCAGLHARWMYPTLEITLSGEENEFEPIIQACSHYVLNSALCIS